jgi:hypothetical protein
MSRVALSRHGRLTLCPKNPEKTARLVTIRLPNGTWSECQTPNYRDANNRSELVPEFQLGPRSHLAR